MVGQPDAGMMNGRPYILGGGYWGGGKAPQENAHTVYVPLVLKNK